MASGKSGSAWRIALAVVALTAAAACAGDDEPDQAQRELAEDVLTDGTVDSTGGAVGDGTANSGVSSPASGPNPAATRGETSPGGEAAGSPATGSGSDAGASAGVRPPGWIPAAPDTHGVTDSTIEVGMLDADATAAFALTGAATGGGASADAFDFKEGNLAGVDAVNSVGGIAGRKVVPVNYTYNVPNFFSASGRQQEAQAACAHWTEDNRVFAFSGSTATDETLSRCAAKAKTPMLITNYHLRLTDSTVRSIWDFYYEPADPTADRAGRALGKFFLAHGFIEKGAKVGLMVEDMDDEIQGAQAIKADLAAAGVALASEIHYPDQIDSPWDSYVLQLQAAGVTDVLWAIQSSQVFPGVFMMQAAENQRFRPRWGFGSDMNMSGLLAFNGPPEQLRNVRAMGWLPVSDTMDESPEAVNAANARVCDTQAKKRGQGVGYPRTQCEWLFFLRAAFQHATVVSPAGLSAGAAAMGDRYGSVMTIGGKTSFADRHDGVTTVRPVAFDSDTNAFAYVGPPEPMPG